MSLNRRDLLRVVLTAGAASAVVAVPIAVESAGRVQDRGKRRSQYQPNSPEVQTFYRVNRYPVK